MFDSESYALAVFAAALLMTVMWAVHLRNEDASIIDPIWGPAIWLVGLVHAVGAGAPLRGARLLVLLIAAAWALRLALHLTIRHSLTGEDRRYRAMREARGSDWWWQSLFVVFLLQAVLASIVALPLVAACTGPRSLGGLGWVGVLLALAGFLYEAIADGQLAAFIHRERNQTSGSEGRDVFDDGLWRFSRHPNYFGEAVVWWGLGLVGAAGGAWWCLLGPATITFMLLRVSGVTMTEADIADRRPAYRDYVMRTNAFFPGTPKARG
ncbi:MAG: DUF1295 domain-containing protein [Planctomycetota bacterium]